MGAWEPIIRQLEVPFVEEGWTMAGRKNKLKRERERLVVGGRPNKWRGARALMGYCSGDVCVSSLCMECGWLLAYTSI